MDRTFVRKTTLKGQDEAFCLSLSVDERLRTIEELGRLGRVMFGYAAAAPMNRAVAVAKRMGAFAGVAS